MKKKLWTHRAIVLQHRCSVSVLYFLSQKQHFRFYLSVCLFVCSFMVWDFHEECRIVRLTSFRDTNYTQHWTLLENQIWNHSCMVYDVKHWTRSFSLSQWAPVDAAEQLAFDRTLSWNNLPPSLLEILLNTLQAKCGNFPVKRAHTQFVREHSATVVSACWATMDWTRSEKWNWCAQADFRSKKKKKKKRRREWMVEFPPKHSQARILCVCVYILLSNTVITIVVGLIN